MLTSSSEYLNALREGQFLLFLEWTDFVTQKYTHDMNLLNSDDMANFLIFEWLSNGYVEDDSKALALLYAVYDLKSKPLRGKLDYSLKAITVALFLSMVFHSHNLCLQLSSSQITSDEINQIINKNIATLDSMSYKTSLDAAQSQFFQWVENADPIEVDIAFQKIDAMTKPRYLVEDYILYLEHIKLNRDPLHTTRLSVAKRFLRYLYEQTELTRSVTNEITAYVHAIRELRPDKDETAYLNSISPPPSLGNTGRWVRGISIGFFSYVLHEKSIGQLISGKSESPELL